MCRALVYLGKPTLVDNFLYQPDSSLVRQSYDPQQLHMLNLGGFGMMSWNPASPNPDEPFSYHSTELPIFSRNLKSIAIKTTSTCLLAHVRGIAYRPAPGFGSHNLHPFRYPGFKLALAHNGDLAGFDRMKLDLLPYMKSSIASQIGGTTDSEWTYALFMSQLSDPSSYLETTEIIEALEKTLRILREVRHRHGIQQSSSLNLFVSDGRRVIGLRFTFDFGCYATEDARRLHEANTRFLSMWFTVGSHYAQVDDEWRMVGGEGTADSLLLASEPLTKDISSWLEVPEYTAMVADRSDKLVVRHVPMDI
jgi:glutamine amidotransferase